MAARNDSVADDNRSDGSGILDADHGSGPHRYPQNSRAPHQYPQNPHYQRPAGSTLDTTDGHTHN